MTNEKLKKLCLAAVLAALTATATMIIYIPMPATNGYIHLGDAMVLLCGFILGPAYGFAAAGLGSMLADLLLGYGAYAPGTFVVKGLCALIAALLLAKLRARGLGSLVCSAVCAEIFMVLGYFVYESLLLGYGWAALGSVFGNCLQAVAGVLAGSLVYHVLYRIPAVRRLVK